MKRTILLYNPHSTFSTMPLGLLAVGSALDRERYDVTILDGRLPSGTLENVVRAAEGALCIGLSVLTGGPIRDALAVSRAVKERYPDLPVVWGGWHASLFPLDTLEEPSIDITVQGQGEETFRRIVERLAAGESMEGLDGLCWKREGVAVRNAPRAMIDMNAFPTPDYALIETEAYYAAKGSRQIDYISSIGCFFRCAFCADPFVYGRTWSGLEPERIVDELEELWRRERFTEVAFQDETFFTYRPRVMRMAEEMIRRDLRVGWTATMRADQGVRMTDQEWELCARSGMRWLLIGVESGSPETLARIRKDITLDQVFHCARICARLGITVVFPVIVGFPGESAQSIQASIDVAKRLRAMSPGFDTPIFYFKPYPGSSITDEAIRDGYRLPATLGEWADFDFVEGSSGPWVDDERFEMIERFKFYNRIAWGRRGPLQRPLQLLARARCRGDYYRFPIEKRIIERLRPPRLR